MEQSLNTTSQNFISKFSLTPEDITSRGSYPGENDQSIIRIRELENGDEEFNYVNLYRIYEPIDKTDPVKTDPHNRKPAKRIRYNAADAQKKGRKYDTEFGSKSKYWYSESLIKQFEKKIPIKTLVVTEGEKKSQVACKYGLPCVGIPGIHSIKDRYTKDLDEGFIDLIKVCKVQNIIILHDADALGFIKLSELNDKGTDLSLRLSDFAAAVRNHRELLKQFDSDIYYCFIKSEFESVAKGLDDLFFLNIGNPQEVVEDIQSLGRANKFFNTSKITALNDTKINKLFFLDNVTSFYKAFHDCLEGKEFIWKNQKYFGENGQAVVKHTEISEHPLSIDLFSDSKNPEADLESYQYYIKGGRYWIRVYTNKRYHDKMISNFVMKIEYHFIDGTNNTKRLIKLKRYSGEVRTIEVLSSESSRKDAFETILKSHNCTFLGSSYDLAVIFQRLMDFQMEAYAISTMGFQPYHDLYVFSNAIINENQLFLFDKDGIARVNNKAFYSPSWSDINKDNAGYQDERNFEYRQGTIDFKTWAELIYKAYGINGGIALLFTINALFRDIVYDEINFFPYLFLFGPAGVGKSSFTDIFLKLFGKKETGESLKNSTIKGLARKCAQRNNGIVFFKEYDANLPPATHKFTKDAYDGAGYTRAMTSNDKRTDTILVQSAIFIDGNVLPSSESAVLDRMIILNFEKDTHTKEEQIAYKELLNKSNDGLGQIVKEILAHRNKFKSEFKNVFSGIYEQLKYSKQETSKFPDRTLKHIALLLTPVDILRKQLVFPFDTIELCDKIIKDASDKVDMLSDLKDVNIFWDAINFELLKEYPRIVSGKHYLREDSELILYFKVKECFPFYTEYCKSTKGQYSWVDQHTLYSLLTADNYAYCPSSQKNRGKKVFKSKFGNCIKLKFESADNEKLVIMGKEIYIKN